MFWGIINMFFSSRSASLTFRLYPFPPRDITADLEVTVRLLWDNYADHAQWNSTVLTVDT